MHLVLYLIFCHTAATESSQSILLEISPKRHFAYFAKRIIRLSEVIDLYFLSCFSREKEL
jgi:hypothetical protein